MQLTEAASILAEDLTELRARRRATRRGEFKMTPMIGRSHGIHAEPITFGLKLALMYDEFGRAEERLAQTTERIRVGKLSGAVGTHAHLDPAIERSVCERLGLKAATLSTQVMQRDRHAEFCTTLALIASSIDRWATEFRHLQRTEVLEVEEFFGEGQKGSSAMPHKRNPITGERLSGLARVIRGHAVAAMENVALWHERDISHSSAERIILPDGCTLLDYMLVKLRELVDGLQVYPDRMAENLALTKGLYFSQSVLLALTRAGAERKTAYEAVQRAAMRTWKGEQNFRRERESRAGDHEPRSACRNRRALLARRSLPARRRHVPRARSRVDRVLRDRRIAGSAITRHDADSLRENRMPLLQGGDGLPRSARDRLRESRRAWQRLGMKKLQELSGQTKTPTMDWNGEVLADFGTDELEEFLRDKVAA